MEEYMTDTITFDKMEATIEKRWAETLPSLHRPGSILDEDTVAYIKGGYIRGFFDGFTRKAEGWQEALESFRANPRIHLDSKLETLLSVGYKLGCADGLIDYGKLLSEILSKTGPAYPSRDARSRYSAAAAVSPN
jgi:hypothetical protein